MVVRNSTNYRGPQLAKPTELLNPAPPAGPMGPTRLFEWLLVDIRICNAVANEREQRARLYAICQELSERVPTACGVIDTTIVIDLTAASKDDRAYLLDLTNWPRPTKERESGE
jgi:hypothetical protein